MSSWVLQNAKCVHSCTLGSVTRAHPSGHIGDSNTVWDTEHQPEQGTVSNHNSRPGESPNSGN